MEEPSTTRPPRVFISHASEDKDRFVRRFAQRLRANGVNAWLDEWELLPGDSLVDRIFAQGIAEADVFVVVLTANSINKPWVQKELNVGVVRQIKDNTRLIPIVLEIPDDQIPAPLRDTFWIRIGDPLAYDTEFGHITGAIFERRDRPPLGPAPAFVEESVADIYGLSHVDSLVLRLLGEAVVDEGAKFLDTDEFAAHAGKFDLAADAVFESLEVLEDHGALELTYVAGRNEPYLARLTTVGAGLYLEAFQADYERLKRVVAASIVNEGLDRASKIYMRTGLGEMLVKLLLDVLELEGHLRLAKGTGEVLVLDTRPSLKRMLH